MLGQTDGWNNDCVRNFFFLNFFFVLKIFSSQLTWMTLWCFNIWEKGPQRIWTEATVYKVYKFLELESWTKYEQIQTESRSPTQTRCCGTGTCELNLFCRCHLSICLHGWVVCLCSRLFNCIKATVTSSGNIVTLDYLYTYTITLLRTYPFSWLF